MLSVLERVQNLRLRLRHHNGWSNQRLSLKGAVTDGSEIVSRLTSPPLLTCEVVLFGLNIIIAVRMLDIGEIFGEDDGFERNKNFKVFL